MPRCYMVKKGGSQRHNESSTPHSPTEASVAPPCYNPDEDQTTCNETRSAAYAQFVEGWHRSAADTEAAHELLSLAQSLPPLPAPQPPPPPLPPLPSLPPLPPPAIVTVLTPGTEALPVYTTYTIQPANIYIVDDAQIYQQPAHGTDIATQTVLDLPLETDAAVTHQSQTLNLIGGPEPGIYHVVPQQSAERAQDKSTLAIPTPVIQHTKNDTIRFSCAQCGKKYATSSNLSRHKQTHRSLDSQAAKKCQECGKVYVSMPALAMHLLTHRMGHACSVCGKQFSRPWLLRGHQRSHTGEKPYSCASCGKAFADRSNLRAHLQTHAHDKKYECPQCRKSFALKSYLNKHLEAACQRDGDTTDDGEHD